MQIIVIPILLIILGIGMELYAFRNKIFKKGGKKMSGEKGLAIILVAMLLSGIGGLIYAGVQNYYIGKDTTSWLNRAQVASNPEDMQDYLIKCRDGMEKWELTDGHAALIFVTPENDMTLVMRALDRSIERCEDIKEMDKKSPEYQTALDDVRGQIRELDLQPTARYWTKYFYIMWMFIALVMIPVIIGLIILFMSLK